MTPECAELHEFQDQLDTARDKAAVDGVTEQDLEDLDAELMDAMPNSVRSHAGLEPRPTTPDLTTTFKTPASVGAAPTAQTQNAEATTPAPLPFQ